MWVGWVRLAHIEPESQAHGSCVGAGMKRARQGVGDGPKPLGGAKCVAFHGRKAGVKSGGLRTVDVFDHEPLTFVQATRGEVMPCSVDSARDAGLPVVCV